MAFWNRNKHRGREPTTDKPNTSEQYKMVTIWGEHYYSWNGKLYDSDIIRACIRPKVKSIGKLVAKHIQENEKGLKVNPKTSIKMLLSNPNPYMTGQMFQEKLANQLCLSNNAFALIVRDENGYAEQMYPIPATMVEAIYGDTGELFLRFTYKNGKAGTFRYSDIIHLRQDYEGNDIFGENPAPALAQLMECVGYIDQGIVKAIKNSGIIRWLLKFTSSMRPEDVKTNVEQFVKNYLAIETDTFGAAGVDAKVDAKQIEAKDYVPNASQTDRITDRIYSFFNTNKHIVQSDWNEDQWTAYYEAEIEPVAIQLGKELTTKLFSPRERGCGNYITYESSNLQCASMSTKLAFQSMVDRGAMTPNEWRAILNLAPIEGGDKPIRRLDTQVVDMLESMLNKMNGENYREMAGLMGQLLKAAYIEMHGGEKKVET